MTLGGKTVLVLNSEKQYPMLPPIMIEWKKKG